MVSSEVNRAADIGSPTQVRGFYDTEWSAVEAQTDEARAAAVFRQLDIPTRALTGRRVLDAGTGLGAHALVMAKQYQARVTAVDIEPACAALAQRRATRAGVHVDISVASIADLPFQTATYDTVVSIGVVHHTGAADRCLGSFFRVLKPGGECYVSVIRRSPLVQIQQVLHGWYGRLPSWGRTAAFSVLLPLTWAVTNLSRGRRRFTPLRVGLRDALMCPFHQVETDQGWCGRLQSAGFEDVKLLRRWNIWGHQGLYYGRKPS